MDFFLIFLVFIGEHENPKYNNNWLVVFFSCLLFIFLLKKLVYDP